MIAFTALFGNDAHDTGHGLAVFCVKGTADQLHLLNRILFNCGTHIFAVIHIGDFHTINKKRDFVGAAAAYMKISPRPDNTGLKLKNILQILNGQIGNIFGPDTGNG